MAKKVIRLTEEQLVKKIKKAICESLAYKLDYPWPEVQQQMEPITEMAKLNFKDNGQSEFPPNTYRVWVQGDNSPHKPAHMHIKSLQEGWTIRIYIENGELWNVENYGKRGRTDSFSDVIKLVKSWFTKPTCMPGRVGTNQQAAQNEWDACN